MNERELIQELTRLPREREPGRDLWPGIASRLTGSGRRRSWPVVAAAAVVVTALAGIIGVSMRTAVDPQFPVGPAQAGVALVYASGVDLEYSGALRDLGGQLRTWSVSSSDSESLRASLEVLVAAGEDLRAAIAENPESVFLAELLASTQRKQLAVMRELVMQRHAARDGGDEDERREA